MLIITYLVELHEYVMYFDDRLVIFNQIMQLLLTPRAFTFKTLIISIKLGSYVLWSFKL